MVLKQSRNLESLKRKTMIPVSVLFGELLKREKSEVKRIFATTIATALALVAGLFWKDAITATINEFLPKSEGFLYQYLAAIIVTIVFAIVIVKITRWSTE